MSHSGILAGLFYEGTLLKNSGEYSLFIDGRGPSFSSVASTQSGVRFA